MSMKRQATTELNHDNWDMNESEAPEEMGVFKSAPQEVLEKRVIRTAKRRTQAFGDQPKKSVFSGFGGFNKTQTSSFDFLAKLTNGNKSNDDSSTKNEASVKSGLFTNNPLQSSPGASFGISSSSFKTDGNKNNDDSLTKNETSVKSGLFTNKPLQSSPGASFGISPTSFKTDGNKNHDDSLTKNETSVKPGLFTNKPLQSSPGASFGISATPFKTVFGTGVSPTSSVFGISTTTSSSVFTSKATDSTVRDTPFKAQLVSSSENNRNIDVPKVTNVTTITTSTQETPSVFGAINNATNHSKLISTTATSSPFKTQSILKPTMNKEETVTSTSNSEKEQTEEKTDKKKMVYYSKLKRLNESVSDWIKKHVEETPLCILSPIFRDYEKHLKAIKAEYEGSDEKETDDHISDKSTPKGIKSTENITTSKTTSVFTNANNSLKDASSLFKTENSKQSIFASSVKNIPDQKSLGFSFGIQNSASTNIPPVAVNSGTGFSFGIKANTQPTTITTTTQSNTMTTSTSFSFKTNPSSITTTTTTTTGTSTAPFSFGTGKPFSFGSNISNKVENSETKKDEGQDDEDQPPKVEYTPIVEENSVFDKRCKIFVKKDDNFIDKGVGTLYIKKIDDTNKHQLLVRANTSLGNVLLNLRLSSSIPTQKMGKNNVMIVCIPTPDSKPPPTPILIRVKTSEEADELLNIINKYKT